MMKAGGRAIQAGRLVGAQAAAPLLRNSPALRPAPGSQTLPLLSPHPAPCRLQVGMKCVALAGRHPVYELSAADLVVRDLAQLSFINLKQLFAAEERVSRQVCVPAVGHVFCGLLIWEAVGRSGARVAAGGHAWHGLVRGFSAWLLWCGYRAGWLGAGLPPAHPL